MAITFTSHTASGSNTDASSYQTASITPTASKLQLAAVLVSVTAAPTAAPTLSGCDITWTEIGNVTYNADKRRLTLFRGVSGSPSAGVVTITTGAAIGCEWNFLEVDGVDTGGTNGSNAIVQVGSNSSGSATTLTATLNAFGAAGNAAFSALAVNNNTAITPGTDFTELAERQDTSPSITLQTQYRVAEDTSVDASWTGAQPCAIYAIELKAGTGGTIGGEAPATTSRHARRTRLNGRARLSGQSVEAGDLTPPAVPANLAATAAAGVSLNWDDNTEDDLAGYIVYRDAAELTRVTASAYLDADATAGVTYDYQIAAYDTNGNASALSTAVEGSWTQTVPDTIDVGSPVYTATYESIEIELPYTVDTNNSASVTVEYKENGSGTWLDAQPLYRHAGASAAFRGSIVNLTANTAYDVQLTITDPDLVADSGLTTHTITSTNAVTTRNDAITAVGSITINRYLDAVNGDDAYDGTSATFTSGTTGPVKTLDRAIALANAASAAQGWQVANGYYQRSTTALSQTSHAITFKAASPAVTNDTTRAAVTTAHAIVYEQYVAPTSSDQALDTTATAGCLGKGGWTPYTNAGGQRVWGLDVNSTKVKQIGYSVVVGGDYAAAKLAAPNRLAHWKFGTTGAMSTWESFAEIVHTNLSYNAGAYQESGQEILYVLLPDDVDPNTCYIWMGLDTGNAGDPGVNITGDNHRICGLEFRHLCAGIRIGAGADGNIIDHNVFQSAEYGVEFKASNGSTPSVNTTIQYNNFTDTNLWVDDPGTTPGIPWEGVKQQIVLADGTYLSSNKWLGRAETSAVKMLKGGRRVVFRHNTVEGWFNGFGSNGGNTSVSDQREVDIHDNIFRNMADNCIEPEGVSINWRVWNNTYDESRNVYSTDFSHGPLYCWRNRSWGIGVQGITGDGKPGASSTGGNGQIVKYGSGHSPGPKIYLVNETHWSNETGTKGFTNAVGDGYNEQWVIRNCLFRATDYVFQMPVNSSAIGWDEDYNVFASDTTAGVTNSGFQFKATFYNASAVTGANSLAAYRLGTGGGSNTNKLDGDDLNFINAGALWDGLDALDALFTDTATGDLTLLASNNAGTAVDNLISEATPDLGYVEKA